MKVILNLTFVVDINPEGLAPPLSTWEIVDKLQSQFMSSHGGNFWFDHDFSLAKFVNDGMDRVNACSVIVLEE